MWDKLWGHPPHDILAMLRAQGNKAGKSKVCQGDISFKHITHTLRLL